MRTPRLGTALWVLAACCLANPAYADLTTLNDDELASINGQALIEIVQTEFAQRPLHFVADFNRDGYRNEWRNLSNSIKSRIDPATGRTFEDGYAIDGWPTDDFGKEITGPIQFTKMRFGADIDIDVDISKMWLGGYDPNHKGGWDLKQDNIVLTGWRNTILGIPHGAYYPFHLGKPYIEFATKNGPTGKEVLGIRIGFEEMDGLFGMNFRIGTGRGFVTSSVLGGLATATVNNYGRRAEGDHVLLQLPPNFPIPTEILDAFPGVEAHTSADGRFKYIDVADKGLTHTDALCVGRTPKLGACQASTETTSDFWISFSKVNTLMYPATNTKENFPAQKGVWLNLTDNVRTYSVIGLTGIFALANTGPANLRSKRW
ncbi:hypothetical protein [Chitinivorax sp. B]|uniref:hypothetical protein n=1 Tax=Chitinivorax sp. B TaxID=2502235 RepID=UPI0010F516CA|nr:hypothetical protein [Chitinivorax sp. B]